MNYEDAFKNYENGTATEEEKAFVRAELEKAKSLGNILDAEVVEQPSPITQAEVTEIKKAKKHFKIKHILFALGALALVIVMVGAILGGVFGSAAVSAKKQITVSTGEAVEIGKVELLDWLNDMRNDSNGQLQLPGGTFNYTIDEIRYEDIDTDFVYELPLGDSHYVYKIEFEVRDTDYKVHVDSRDGKVLRIRFDN
jgi:hypothetical protein